MLDDSDRQSLNSLTLSYYSKLAAQKQPFLIQKPLFRRYRLEKPFDRTGENSLVPLWHVAVFPLSTSASTCERHALQLAAESHNS